MFTTLSYKCCFHVLAYYPHMNRCINVRPSQLEWLLSFLACDPHKGSWHRCSPLSAIMAAFLFAIQPLTGFVASMFTTLSYKCYFCSLACNPHRDCGIDVRHSQLELLLLLLGVRPSRRSWHRRSPLSAIIATFVFGCATLTQIVASKCATLSYISYFCLCRATLSRIVASMFATLSYNCYFWSWRATLTRIVALFTTCNPHRDGGIDVLHSQL